MLNFFRKYQSYFFFVITAVIIISFTFFGTYSTIDSNPNIWREQLAFKAVNGHEVTRLDVEEMALFLGTDNEDKQLFGGAWGPNFLNDGVIKKDFLQTGLADQLMIAYRDNLKHDLEQRAEKERKYSLYTHPEAKFLGVENVWNHFSPSMVDQYRSLKTSIDPIDPKALQDRVQLFLNEKKIPSSTLRYVLRFQENQYSWLKPDPRLDQVDLSLFGYHTTEDWFGPNFTRLVSEFIINTAILAEQQGYKVTKAEAMADLIRNAQKSFQENIKNPNLGVPSAEQYFSEQLRVMHMDQSSAAKVWTQVLLFRRYFQDAGDIALVDPLLSSQLNQYAFENTTVDLYQLPPELKIASLEDLENFETYLYAVAKQNPKNPLELPNDYLSIEKVAKNYPELVGKRYELEIAAVNQKTIQSSIAMRSLWGWEVEDKNWDALTKEFPVLGSKPATEKQQRFALLDGLNPEARAKVDAWSKQEIVKEHPEWLESALSKAPTKKIVTQIRLSGSEEPFVGLNTKEKAEALLALLDQAPLNEVPQSGSPLHVYSANGQNYYRISVLNRAEKPEILTFADARESGAIIAARDRILEKYYVRIREDDPQAYKKSDGQWQPIAAVKDRVASQLFEKTLSALKEGGVETRLYAHVQNVKDAVVKEPQKAALLIQDAPEKVDSVAAQSGVLSDQWKLNKVRQEVSRQSYLNSVDAAEALALQSGEWSSLKPSLSGDHAFYQVVQKASEENHTVLAEQVRKTQALIGDAAQRVLMAEVLAKLEKAGAISLAYLKQPSDGEGEVQTEEVTP